MLEIRYSLMNLFETFTQRLLLLKPLLYIRILLLIIKLHYILRILNRFLRIINWFLRHTLILNLNLYITDTISNRINLKLVYILKNRLLRRHIFKLVHRVLIYKLIWRFLESELFTCILLCILLLYEAVIFFESVGVS